MCMMLLDGFAWLFVTVFAVLAFGFVSAGLGASIGSTSFAVFKRKESMPKAMRPAIRRLVEIGPKAKGK
jgi:hypothetical protein